MIDLIVLTSVLKEYMHTKKFWIVVSALFVSCIFLFFGFFHIVNGSSYNGSPIVKKLSFGFSETFINVDQVSGMPYIVGRAQFPLSIYALQRAGYLETDQERKIRVEAEYKATMARFQAESEKQILKSQGDMQAALEGLAALAKAAAEEPKQ